MSPLRTAWREYRDAASAFSGPARRFLVSTLFAWSGYGVNQVIFNLYLVEAGFQESVVGRMVALNGIGLAVAALPAGWLAERRGRVPCLLLGTTASSDNAAGGPRIVVVREADGARRRAGLRVDALGPVRELPRGLAGLDPAPVTLSVRLRPFVKGLLSEAPICSVLEVRSLFDAPDLAALAGGDGPVMPAPSPEGG